MTTNYTFTITGYSGFEAPPVAVVPGAKEPTEPQAAKHHLRLVVDSDAMLPPVPRAC